MSFKLVIGQVIERAASNPNFLKIKIQRMKLDESLLMYFPDLTEKWVVDKKSQAQLGDIVTINPLSKKLTPEIKDEVHSIVFNQGAVIDPITGRMCRGTNFIDEKQREEEKLRRDTVDLTVTTTKYVDKVKKS